jgi:hypothetical protein
MVKYRRILLIYLSYFSTKNLDGDIEGSWPLWAKLPAKQRYELTRKQMRKDLNEFYEKFKQTYKELRRKHSLQIEALRNQKKGQSGT